MKKALILIFVLVCNILLADGVAPIGEGSEENPYQIATLDNLFWFNDFDFSVANPNSQYGDYYFEQTAGINAYETRNWNDGKGFKPLGTNAANNEINYDGKNKYIVNLYINRPEENKVGFISFGRCKKLRLTDCSIVGKDFVGGIAGYASLRPYFVKECFVSGAIKGRNNVGGIVGLLKNAGLFECKSEVRVEGISKVGGLAGALSYTYNGDFFNNNYNSVNRCGVIGTVVGENQVAGIGTGKLKLSNCYFSGNIEVEENFAGIFGSNHFENSFFNFDGTLVNNERLAHVAGLPYGAFRVWKESRYSMDLVSLSRVLNQDSNGTYLISKANDLYFLSEKVLSDSNNFRLTSDIDMKDILGISIEKFSSNFDGNNFKIFNYAGAKSIFDEVNNATIKRLHIERSSEIDFPNTFFKPVINTLTNSTLENCSVKTPLITRYETFSPLVNTATNSLIKQCYVKGNFKADGEQQEGYGNPHYTFYYKNYYFGGIANDLIDSSIEECCFEGSFYIPIEDIIHPEDVSYSPENNTEMGGSLVCKAVNSSIKNSYSRKITSTRNEEPRIIGKLIGQLEDSDILNCYTSVSSYNDKGLIGVFGYDSENTIQNSFWLCDEPENADEYSLTTAQMQNINTFTNAGWDFAGETENGTDDIWTYDDNSDYNFPVLSWENLPLVDEKDEFNTVPLANALKLSNYPNPFNPSTQICFEIPKNQTANLSIYNVKGQLVKSYKNLKHNQKSVTWLGKNKQNQPVASGVYFYKLKTKNKAVTNKMLLVK